MGIAAIVAVSVTAASASGLGGLTTAGLAGFSFSTSSGAPTVIAQDAFDGTNGTALSGATTDDGNHTWTQFGGTWTISGNKAKSTKASPSGLIVNTGVSSGAAEVTITGSGPNYDAEVLFNASSTGNDHLLLTWLGGGALELWKYVGGTYTRLATLGSQGTPTNRRIRIESTTGNQLLGYIDGVLKLSYTLTAGEQTTFKNASHTYAGLVAYNDNSSTFDDFHAES